MTKLTLNIIDNYGMEKETYRPDYDDMGFKYTLPSGFEVSGLFMCNNLPCEMDMLESEDGHILIETKEELDKFYNMTWEETVEEIKKEFPEFDEDEY